MNRMSWLLVVPLALVSSLSAWAGCVEFDNYAFEQPDGGAGTGATGGMGGGGAGGMGASSTGSGGMMQCMAEADCTNTECRTGGTCVGGVCDWTEVAPGVPVGAQIYGDCKQRECDLGGSITQTDAPADVYDWKNPCYVDDCNAGMNPVAAVGVTCMTKWGKATGQCTSSFKCVECAVAGDCAGIGTCEVDIGKCIPTHCSNGTLDAASPMNETDVDCGGPCLPCADGKICKLRSDCEGDGVCSGSPTKTCAAPTCNDGFQDGDETDQDCGGSCPEKCGDMKGCHVPGDCVAGLSCKSGVCTP